MSNSVFNSVSKVLSKGKVSPRAVRRREAVQRRIQAKIRPARTVGDMAPGALAKDVVGGRHARGVTPTFCWFCSGWLWRRVCDVQLQCCSSSSR